VADGSQRSPEEIRRAAHEIVSRREFRPPPRSPVQAALDWMGRQLDHFFNHLPYGKGNVIGWIIAAAGVAAIVVLLVRFARNIQRDPGHALPVDTDVGRLPTDWQAEAVAHESAGEWREALRCRYRAMVATLAARGLIDEVPGRTSGEYRAAVTRAVPGAAPDFSGATELFERSWYGGKATGPEDSARFRELSERVLVGAER
jgi:hypothetical protein